MSKRIAVIIGDVHFTIPTLELATSALKQAMDKARELKVPLIINGDTLDSKDIVRGRVMNRLIELLDGSGLEVYVNTGNHDLVHEKSKESSLNFLKPYVTQVISSPTFIKKIDSWIIPYQSFALEFKWILDQIKPGSRIIIHNGIQGARMGHYVVDSSSIPREWLAQYRTIASHYHCYQDLLCNGSFINKDQVGVATYIGNPYTLSFGEAYDPPKGFAILEDDGSTYCVPTNLRKHVIVETSKDFLPRLSETLRGLFVRFLPDDLLWVRVLDVDTKFEQSLLPSKEDIGRWTVGNSNFKLDFIPSNTGYVKSLLARIPTLNNHDLFDTIIDATTDPVEQKSALKALWKEILDETK